MGTPPCRPTCSSSTTPAPRPRDARRGKRSSLRRRALRCTSSQYAQNGTVHGGKAYVPFGTDITGIILTATVSHGTLKGIMIIEYF